MAEIRGGFSWASLFCVIALIGVGIYLMYEATHKTDVESYTKGAQHSEITIAPVENNYPLAFPRCGRTFSIDPNWFQPYMNMAKDKK